MQPLKLTLVGDFWDSLIYKGRLYLWDMDNVLHVYDWDSFIASIAQGPLRLPLTCGFAEGDTLYRHPLQIVTGDPDIRSLLSEKFASASESDYVFTFQDLEAYLLGRQDSPFDSLHDDSAIYNNELFALTGSGLRRAEANKPKKNVYKVERKSEKIWDGAGTSLQAGRGYLAIAAADDGIFEWHLSSNSLRHVSERHALFASWNFTSIYGSSDIGPGYLAVFRWRTGGSWSHRKLPLVREFARMVDEEGIFGPLNQEDEGSGHISWGSQEKLYRAGIGWIETVRYTQKYAADPQEDRRPFQTMGKIRLNNADLSAMGPAVSGNVAFFGVVVEFDEGLAVVTSDNIIHAIAGPVTRWRVFPRSVHYENQLHVILEDRLDIYSFNNDYFVDQASKTAGIEYRNSTYTDSTVKHFQDNTGR